MSAQTPEPQSLVQTVRAALEASDYPMVGDWYEVDAFQQSDYVCERDIPILLNAPEWLAALCDQVEELERELDAEAKHAALGPGESCDICTHREMEQMIARAEAAEAAIERVNEALSRLESDEREHLIRVGQHLHVSAEVLVRIIRAALDAQHETGADHG